MTEEHKRKIGEANKISHKGKVLSEEHKKHISDGAKGKNCNWSQKRREKFATSRRKPYDPKRGTFLHFDRIENEVEKLKAQGFRVIPITRVIPDMIAIKDNQVYAIEVEYNQPNYKKYRNETMKSRYDAVMWILRGNVNCQIIDI